MSFSNQSISPIQNSSNSLSISDNSLELRENPTIEKTYDTAVPRLILSEEPNQPITSIISDPNDAIEMDLNKIDSPEESLKKIQSLDREIKNLQDEIEKVHEKGVLKAKNMKIHSITRLPQNELNKLEFDLLEYQTRLMNRKEKLEKFKSSIQHLAEGSPIKVMVDDKISEVELRIKTSEKSLKWQLYFYAYTRLSRFMEKVAKILHEIEETMKILANIR